MTERVRRSECEIKRERERERRRGRERRQLRLEREENFERLGFFFQKYILKINSIKRVNLVSTG